MSSTVQANTAVTVYTKSHCPQCDSTKSLLKKLSVPFQEISIEENPEVLEFLKAEGFRSAPVVMTDEDSWGGFNEQKIRSLATEDTEDEDWDF